MKMLSSNCKLLLRLSLCVSLLMIVCIRCSSSRTLQGHEYDGEFSIVGYSPGVLTSTDKLVELFESWMLKHGKSYESTEEKLHRHEIFKDNLKHIDERNRDLQITSSYWLGLNEFSDMSHEEFKNKYLTGLKPNDDEFRRRSHRDSSSSSNHFLYKNVEDLPQSVDWRKKGAVTHVKNQNPCGGCWAFSAVAAVEGINQIVTGNLTALSEQELLSCDTNNFGCEGGLLFYAFEYIASNGIHAEEDYPFVGDQPPDQANSSCKLIDKAAAAEVVTISGYQNVPENDEGSLLKALANQPVSVGIEASSRDFQHYSGGIFDGSCGTYPNHAVTAVGYGSSSSSSPESVDYIIVKNSWGPKWGEGGYIRIKRNTGLPGGLCAINKLASFPIKFKAT